MIDLFEFVEGSFEELELSSFQFDPFSLIPRIKEIITDTLTKIGKEYAVQDGIAIHRSVVIEAGAVIKPPAILSEGCFVASGAYLRGGVLLSKNCVVGPGSEVKGSIIGEESHIAHFNFIGDSIIGSKVNFEAGSITANHWNEREDKKISVLYKGEVLDSGLTKMGAIVGNRTKIGANAVLSPGTLLFPGAVVARLSLVQQA